MTARPASSAVAGWRLAPVDPVALADLIRVRTADLAAVAADCADRADRAARAVQAGRRPD